MRSQQAGGSTPAAILLLGALAARAGLRAAARAAEHRGGHFPRNKHPSHFQEENPRLGCFPIVLS